MRVLLSVPPPIHTVVVFWRCCVLHLHSFTASYYRGADACILVFDKTKPAVRFTFGRLCRVALVFRCVLRACNHPCSSAWLAVLLLTQCMAG